MSTQDDLAAWMAQYQLVESQVRTSGMFCMLPLLGRHCKTRSSGRRNTCPGCLPRTLGDHGKYFRLRDDNGPMLFTGHVYDEPSAAEFDVLDDLVNLGLYYQVGRKGSGWYNNMTVPILVSTRPIPNHNYCFWRP